MNKLMATLLVSTLFSTPLFANETTSLNTALIEQLAGVKGFYNSKAKTFKVTQPRNDLKVSLSGVKMMPTMGLTSWVSFKNENDDTLIMGDLVLSEDQINPVMSVVLNNGLHISSLQNHFLWESPKVMFMHIEGCGTQKELASAVGKVFKAIKDSTNGEGSFPLASIEVSSENTTLNPRRIESILGNKGSLKDGVYKVTFNKKPEIDGNEVMAVNSWAAFAGSDKEAVVTGDFAVDESQLDQVLLTLQKSGIYVVSIYQHVSNEDPEVVFLHYIGIGTTQKLAKAIKTALNTVSTLTEAATTTASSKPAAIVPPTVTPFKMPLMTPVNGNSVTPAAFLPATLTPADFSLTTISFDSSLPSEPVTAFNEKKNSFVEVKR